MCVPRKYLIDQLMPRLLLTEITLRALKPPAAGQVDYWDTKSPGFGIRVGAHAKTFVAKVSNRRHTLGTYQDLSLQEARRKAFALKGEGKPISVAKLTFGQAYERFKSDHIAGKRASTAKSYKRVLEKYLLPKFEKTLLAKITYEDIAVITDRLKDTPSEQAHTLATMRCFFRWCTRPPRRYIRHSPLEGIQIKLAKGRKRVLTDQELAKVWRAAQAQGYPHGCVIQLLILTGLRKSEAGSLSWPWLNEQDCTLTLPETLTKNKTEHLMPYGPLAAQIFAAVPRGNSTPFLFPSWHGDDRPFSGWSKFKTELNDGCAHWTLHDLRRTLANLRCGGVVAARLCLRY